jgi:hypothetical protein
LLKFVLDADFISSEILIRLGLSSNDETRIDNFNVNICKIVFIAGGLPGNSA